MKSEKRMRWQTPSLYAWGWLEALVKEEFRIKADTCSGKSTRFWLENYSPVYRANKVLETWAWVFLMVKPKCSNSIPAALRCLPSPSVMNSITLRNTYEISLVVEGLGPGTFIATAQVQSLVRELKSLKPHGATKKKKKRSIYGLKHQGPDQLWATFLLPQLSKHAEKSTLVHYVCKLIWGLCLCNMKNIWTINVSHLPLNVHFGTAPAFPKWVINKGRSGRKPHVSIK